MWIFGDFGGKIRDQWHHKRGQYLKFSKFQHHHRLSRHKKTYPCQIWNENNHFIVLFSFSFILNYYHMSEIQGAYIVSLPPGAIGGFLTYDDKNGWKCVRIDYIWSYICANFDIGTWKKLYRPCLTLRAVAAWQLFSAGAVEQNQIGAPLVFWFWRPFIYIFLSKFTRKNINGKYSGQKSLFLPPQIWDLISSLFLRQFFSRNFSRISSLNGKTWKMARSAEIFEDFVLKVAEIGWKWPKSGKKRSNG